MKRNKHKHAKLSWRGISKRAHLVGFLALFAVVGAVYLASTRAATHAVPAEVEKAQLSGRASALDVATASSAKAVLFGFTDATPKQLLAFVGGDSIALRCTPVYSFAGTATAYYELYRNNLRIATIDPNVRNFEVPDSDTCGYVDKNVTKGNSYSYQIAMVDARGWRTGLSKPVTVTHPFNSPPVPTITIDTSLAPDLRQHIDTKVVPMLKVWYPKMAYALSYPDFIVPKTVGIKIIIDDNELCYAKTDINSIYCNAKAIRDNQDDFGVWLHEAMHVTQHYKGGMPSWASEGIADYVREYILHDRDPIVPYPGIRPYTEGYSEASYFLNWIQNKYDPQFIRKLNTAGRSGSSYETELVRLTGKNYNQLYTSMLAETYSMARSGAITVKSQPGKCLETALQPGSTSFTVLRVNTCNGSEAQKFETLQYANSIRLLGMSVVSNKRECTTDINDAAYILSCNRTGTFFTQEPDGQIRSALRVGRCMTLPNNDFSNGTEIKMLPCEGAPGQMFTSIK